MAWYKAKTLYTIYIMKGIAPASSGVLLELGVCSSVREDWRWEKMGPRIREDKRVEKMGPRVGEDRRGALRLCLLAFYICGE